MRPHSVLVDLTIVRDFKKNETERYIPVYRLYSIHGRICSRQLISKLMPKRQAGIGPTEASWTRTHLTLVAVAVLKRFRPRISSVLFLTSRICVKYDPFQHLSDAAAMQFIASHTSVPVPKVYCAFHRKGTTYIVMSRIAGTPIGHK